MIKLFFLFTAIIVCIPLKAEPTCKGSPINQGEYFNKMPPKVWSDCIGNYIYLNGVGTYKGLFQNGQPNGNGELKLYNGSYYQGNWHNGVIQGYGLVFTVDRIKYEGQWQHDTFKGYALFHDGTRYEGTWLSGYLEGEANLYYPDKTSYKGSLKKGIYHGYGELIDQSLSLIHI